MNGQACTNKDDRTSLASLPTGVQKIAWPLNYWNLLGFASLKRFSKETGWPPIIVEKGDI